MPQYSDSERANRRARMVEFNRSKRPLLVRCDATAKSSGQRCGNLPSNGRSKCRFHGGATGRGDDWHKRLFRKRPKASALTAERRISEKLHRVEADTRGRIERRGAMSMEEREKHDAWQRSHGAGSAAARKRARETRKQNAEARALLEHVEQAHNAEGQALADRIAELRKLAAALGAQRLTGGIFD